MPRRLESGEVRLSPRIGMERALCLALNELRDAVVVLEPPTRHILLVNDAACALFATASDELLDTDVLDHVASDARAIVEARLDAHATGADDEPLLDAAIVQPTGRRVRVEMSARPFDAEGGRRFVVAVLRERAPDDPARALDELRDAVRSRDDFLSVAAHELRTPLTPLMLHVQTLTRLLDVGGAPSAADLRQSLQKVERQVTRLARLVDHLLDVSRIRAGRLTIDKERVDLAVIVRDVVARYAPDAARAGSAIAVMCEEAVLGAWDPMRVDQIVTNLVSNAIKYGAGRPIEVWIDADRERARLHVRDHGPGIAPEDQARIFDRFERAVGARAASGLGLGLWIARQVVEAHGGTIYVASTPGEGSRFVVELPR